MYELAGDVQRNEQTFPPRPSPHLAFNVSKDVIAVAVRLPGDVPSSQVMKPDSL
jgi:hypothetical protein